MLTHDLSVLAHPRSSSLNPYCDLLYGALSRHSAAVTPFTKYRLLTAGGHDVWHIHWPENIYDRAPTASRARLQASAFLLAADLARAAGTSLVWTAHDAKPHRVRYPELGERFWERFVRRLDGVIHLSRAGREAAEATHPEIRSLPSLTTAHGHYRSAFSGTPTRREARDALGYAASDRIVGFFGRLTDYKNVEALVTAFQALDGLDVKLLIAGPPTGAEAASRLRRIARSDTRIELHAREIAHGRVPLYVRAADVLVFPFKDITHSGSVALALSLGRPVLAPAIGALPEWSETVGAEWLRTYTGRLDGTDLSRAISSAVQEKGTASRPDLEGCSWERIASETTAFFRELSRSRS